MSGPRAMTLAERIADAALHVVALAGGAAFYYGQWRAVADLVEGLAR